VGAGRGLPDKGCLCRRACGGIVAPPRIRETPKPQNSDPRAGITRYPAPQGSLRQGHAFSAITVKTFVRPKPSQSYGANSDRPGFGILVPKCRKCPVIAGMMIGRIKRRWRGVAASRPSPAAEAAILLSRDKRFHHAPHPEPATPYRRPDLGAKPPGKISPPGSRRATVHRPFPRRNLRPLRAGQSKFRAQVGFPAGVNLSALLSNGRLCGGKASPRKPAPPRVCVSK